MIKLYENIALNKNPLDSMSYRIMQYAETIDRVHNAYLDIKLIQIGAMKDVWKIYSYTRIWNSEDENIASNLLMTSRKIDDKTMTQIICDMLLVLKIMDNWLGSME